MESIVIGRENVIDP